MKSVADLKGSIEEILGAGVNLTMYFGMGTDSSRVYRKANLLDGATADVLRTYVDGLRRYLGNDDLTVRQLSRFDQRADCLWLYNLAEQPPEFANMKALALGGSDATSLDRSQALFSFRDNNIGDIKTIAVRIASADDSIVLIKKFYPVSLIKRDQLLLFKSNDRLDVFKEDLIKIGFGFEILIHGDDLYINDFGKFERAFAFAGVAEKASRKLGKTVLELGIVNDAKGYLRDGKISKKDILRTADSIVLTLKPAQILKFAVQKGSEIGLKVTDGKMQINSLDSVRKLFNLLNDDYLTSELTSRDYQALAKDEMVIES